MVIWITGLSGSGKSTLARYLITNLSTEIRKKSFIWMEMRLGKFLVP